MKYIDGYCIIYYENERNVIAIQDKRTKVFYIAPDFKQLKVAALYTDSLELSGINISGNLSSTDKTKIIAYARRDDPQATPILGQELVQISVTFNNEELGFTDFEIKNYFE